MWYTILWFGKTKSKITKRLSVHLRDNVCGKSVGMYEISGYHHCEEEDECVQGDHPDNGGHKHLWNIGKFLPDCMA